MPAIALRQSTDAQPVPEQWQPWQNAPPQLLLSSMMFYEIGHAFGQLGSVVPSVSPPNFLCMSSSLPVGGGV